MQFANVFQTFTKCCGNVAATLHCQLGHPSQGAYTMEDIDDQDGDQGIYTHYQWYQDQYYFIIFKTWVVGFRQIVNYGWRIHSYFWNNPYNGLYVIKYSIAIMHYLVSYPRWAALCPGVLSYPELMNIRYQMSC